MEYLFAKGDVNRGEYIFPETKSRPIFTQPEANNFFRVITQVSIREKQEPSENCQFCLFQIVTRQWTEKRSLRKTHAQSKSHGQSINCTCLKQYVSFFTFSFVSMRKNIHLTSSVHEC